MPIIHRCTRHATSVMGSMCSMYADSRDTWAKRLTTNAPLSSLGGACTADAIFLAGLRASIAVDVLNHFSVVVLGAVVVVAFDVLEVLVAALFVALVRFVALVVTISDSTVDFVRNRACMRPPCLVCAAVVRGSGRGWTPSTAHPPSPPAVFPVVAVSRGDSYLVDNVALGAEPASISVSRAGRSSSCSRISVTCFWTALGSHS